MIKKFTLLLVMLLGVVGSINAKSNVTILWEGTDTGADISVARSSLVAGATITLEFNWLGTEGSSFGCFYWKNDAWTYLNNYQWQWVDNGKTYSFTITQDQIDDIPADQPLYFKSNYIDKMTFKTITSSTEIVPTDETELLDADWTASETAKVFAAQAGAKVKDVIKFTYTAYKDDATDWPWVTLNLKDSEDGALDAIAVSNEKNSVNTYEYEITDFDVLDKIQTGGFKVTGQECTVTSVKLLTYADSYIPVSVTIGSDGIATWSHGQNLDFSGTDIKVYYASEASAGVVTLSPTTTTWNWQGYILKGDEGTYRVGVIPDSKATFPSGNLLRGQVNAGPVYRSQYTEYTGESDTDNIKNKYRYIFAKHGTNIGFYLLPTNYSEDNNPYHTLAANKAYLETATDLSADSPFVGSRGLSLDFGDGTTAIWSVKEDKVDTGNVREDGVYYTLQGTRVQNPSKGLYILNGKKVIVK
ncbi:MAG: hypothetical protein IKM77_07065 [Prevotella sp.]|nr:hypothetical protein [Prevotella sp.]